MGCLILVFNVSNPSIIVAVHEASDLVEAGRDTVSEIISPFCIEEKTKLVPPASNVNIIGLITLKFLLLFPHFSYLFKGFTLGFRYHIIGENN